MALKAKKGNHNAKLINLEAATNELQWWLGHIPLANRSITLPEVDFIITSDASEEGWGATDGPKLFLLHKKFRFQMNVFLEVKTT